VKEAISLAARTVLLAHGLTGWSIEAVAREAGCAKGLVIYHGRTRNDLLAKVARGLSGDRATHRLEPWQAPGTAGLDRLWNTLAAEVRTGEFAAWVTLSASKAREVSAAAAPPADFLPELGSAARQALNLPAERSPEETGRLIDAVIGGFQLQLLHRTSPVTVREVYHRFWLGLMR